MLWMLPWSAASGAVSSEGKVHTPGQPGALTGPRAGVGVNLPRQQVTHETEGRLLPIPWKGMGLRRQYSYEQGHLKRRHNHRLLSGWHRAGPNPGGWSTLLSGIW